MLYLGFYVFSLEVVLGSGFYVFSSQIPLLLCLRLVRQAMKIPTFDVVSWFLSFFVWRWGWVVGFGGFSSQIPRLLSWLGSTSNENPYI